MSVHPGLLFDVIARAARERRDLAAELRACGHAGAASVAAALARGASLDAALAGVIDPGLARLLAGPIPDLERIAQLAHGEWCLRQQHRDSLLRHLAYPCLSMLTIVLGAGVFLALWPYATAWYWLGLALPAVILLLIALALPYLGPIRERVPLIGGWYRHGRLSRNYGRAALVARWRLTEAEAQRLLDFDCAPLIAVLARPDASDHCQQLAQHHAHHADHVLEILGRIAAVLILSGAGAVVLMLAISEVQQYLAWCMA